MRRVLFAVLIVLMPIYCLGAEPERLADDGRLEFLKVVLNTSAVEDVGDDFVMVGEGEAGSKVLVKGYSAWRLDGEVVEYAAMVNLAQDQAARDAFFPDNRKKRPKEAPYEGLKVGVLHRFSEGQPKATLMNLPPAKAVHNEFGRWARPRKNKSGKWMVDFTHQAITHEPKWTRVVRYCSELNLTDVTARTGRELGESRLVLETAIENIYVDGVLVERKVMRDDRFPPQKRFIAQGKVTDSDGQAISNADIFMEWSEGWSSGFVSSLSRDRHSYQAADEWGKFEKTISGSWQAMGIAYKVGYFPSVFYITERDKPPTVMLEPVPEVPVKDDDLVLCIKGLLHKNYRPDPDRPPALGLKFTENPHDGDFAGEWVNSKEDADLWFEIIDPDYGNSLEREEARIRKAKTWIGRLNYLEVRMTALKDTSFAPMLEREDWDIPYVSEIYHHRVAPEKGYITELTGVVRPPRNITPPKDKTLHGKPLQLPWGFYIKKGERYGKIENLTFDLILECKDCTFNKEADKLIGGQMNFVWRGDTADVVFQRRPLKHLYLAETEKIYGVPEKP